MGDDKGGLDARYACSRLGLAPLVASLTTINTPHRGCAFADWLLSRVSPRFRDGVARTYNAALRRLGDRSPDFLAAVTDLTAAFRELVIETPSWGYGDSGTRFGVFPQPGRPRDVFEKLDVSDRTRAVTRAMELGLLRAPGSG